LYAPVKLETFMKHVLSAFVLTALMGAPAAAETSPHTVTGNVALASDYVFRGISQTGGDPAIQGGLDYTHRSGVYLGTWGSNVGWIEDFQGYASGNIELDLYGGLRGTFGATDVSYDVGVIGYFYPGKANGAVDANTTEAYAAFGWKGVTVKYFYSLGGETFGFANSRGSGYLDVSVGVPLGETGLTLGAHWGRFSFDNNGAQDYDDWKLSAAYDLGRLSGTLSGVTLGVAWSDTDTAGGDGTGFSAPWTDANGQDLGAGTAIVWISKAL
jgi:uncharacterized protein (TIGR02001 family)